MGLGGFVFRILVFSFRILTGVSVFGGGVFGASFGFFRFLEFRFFFKVGEDFYFF